MEIEKQAAIDTANGVFRNIFDEPVSVFSPTPTGKHHVRTIGQFLDAAPLYADNIAKVRAARKRMAQAAQADDMAAYKRAKDDYTNLKWQSPYAILQGQCPDKSEYGFTCFSNVLCIDIDAPKPTETNALNSWVNDWEQVKGLLASFPWVAYCAISAGGEGVFCLVPVADAEHHHKDYFAAVAQTIKQACNIDADEGTKNINRLRFMTYDPNPYINRNALVWDRMPRQDERQAKPQRSRMIGDRSAQPSTLTETDRRRVKLIVEYCLKHNVSVTYAYDDWMKVGGFFAHQWGDAEGDSLFHELSQLDMSYRPIDADRKLMSMARYHPHPATLTTFYRECRDNGVPVPDEWMPRFNTGLYFPPVAPIQAKATNKERTKRNHQRSEEEAKKTELSQVDVDAVPGADAAPVTIPAIGIADAAVLEDKKPDIQQAYKNLSKIEGFSEFISNFEAFVCGIGDWCMNDAQMAYTAATLNKNAIL